MRVFDGLETAVLTAVLDEEDDFRRGGTPGRGFRAAAVVLAVVAFVAATIFRRPRGGRSGLAFRVFSFLRSSFDEVESPSSLIMVLYDGWSLATLVTVGFDLVGGGGRLSCGDGISETSIPSGIVGVADDRVYGIGGDGGASGNACCRKSVIALCEGNFDEPSWNPTTDFTGGIGLGGGVGGHSTSRDGRGVVNVSIEFGGGAVIWRGAIWRGGIRYFVCSNCPSPSTIIMNIADTFAPENVRSVRSLPHIRQNKFSRRRPLSRTSRLIV